MGKTAVMGQISVESLVQVIAVFPILFPQQGQGRMYKSLTDLSPNNAVNIIQGILTAFENALMALALDPEECNAYFETLLNWKIEYIKKIAKYYQVDVINFHDDYGAADRMFMKPELWREIIKPHLKRVVDACHELGLLYQHHSCGYVEPILPDMAEIGADAIDTLQACNTDLPELKKQLGSRLTFCGGFGNQHVLDVPGVSPEAVKKEYRRAIDSLAPGGSYVIYPIGGSFEFVPAFLEEHFQYGMKFYADKSI